MPHLNLSMTQSGPFVDIWISVSDPRRDALRAADQEVKPAVKVRALIDTGASCTVIDASILKKLAIPCVGVTPIFTPSTGEVPHVCHQYDVSLGILDAQGDPLFLNDSLSVLGSDLPDVDALIGRDVLAKGILIYNGAAGTFTLSY